MKKLLLSVALIAALCGVGLVATGCKTPVSTATYQTVGVTATTVEGAMNEWAAWVKAGKATVAQEIQVRDAYRKYQAAMAAVCDAGAVYAASASTNSAGATGVSAALQQAIGNASLSISDVQNLINQFTGGVK